MRQRDQLVRRRDHRRHRVQIDAVILGQRDHIDMRADLRCHHLPRHDVAVMLQRAQQDAITRFQLRYGPAFLACVSVV